jgi:hypothetical protein
VRELSFLHSREIGLFHLLCCVRQVDPVFETYWTKRRGCEAMDNSYGLIDLMVFGPQESWKPFHQITGECWSVGPDQGVPVGSVKPIRALPSGSGVWT